MLMRNRKRRCLAWLAAGLLTTAAAGCRDAAPRENRETASVRQEDHGTQSDTPRQEETGPEEGPGDARRVSIDNFTFHPETLEITAGTKVIWVNSDDVPHTVRSTEDLFRSGALDTDDVYEHVFTDPGTFEYYCGVHRHMTGKVVVK